MAERRSDELWKTWREGSEKFDYFMVGLASALTAYLGQNLVPAKVAANPATAELASVVCLCGSVVAGLLRIQFHLTALVANQHMLFHGESAGTLTEVAMSPSLGINKATGDIISPAEAAANAQLHKKRSGEARELFRINSRRAEIAHHVRNAMLLLGFVLLVGGKVWRALLVQP